MAMKRLRVGIASYAKFKARTMAIARVELVPSPGDPTLWFPSMESESLSRTLRTMERHGHVATERGQKRTLVPRVAYSRTDLALPLTPVAAAAHHLAKPPRRGQAGRAAAGAA
jgi:predicted transcriptional regulator